MNERNLKALFAAVVMTAALASPATAQESGGEPAAASEADESAETRGPKAAEDGGDEADEDGDAAGDSESEEETAETSGDGDTASEQGAAKEDSGPKTGPGGKPLRDDYPGTEESRQARMDTEKVEGLDIEAGETPEDVYDMRIRELETRVDDLKEKVFQSKSRIVLLKETVLSGNISGSRAILNHNTDLGGAYKVVRILYSLDGARVFNKSGELGDEKNFEIYNGSISPGNHKLSILVELKGSGYGVFSYMKGYKFRLKDSCSFKAQSGKNTIVDVKLYDRGRAKYEYEERPGVRCSVSAVDYAADDVANADTATQENEGDEPAQESDAQDQEGDSSE